MFHRGKASKVFLAASAVLAALACGSPGPSGAASSAPAWESSLEGALRRAAAEKKLVMVFFYTDWCGWCRRMDERTFADGQVQAALTGVVPVRLNAEKDGRAEAARLRVNSYPNIAFLDASGRQVARIPGFLPAPAFLEELRDVLNAAAGR
jgi:thiol:disulfide interchange protein